MIGPLMILDLPTTNNKYITSNITKVIKQKTNILPKKNIKKPFWPKFLWPSPPCSKKMLTMLTLNLPAWRDFSFWGPVRHRDLTHDPTVPRVEAWGMIGPPRQCPSHPSLPSLRALDEGFQRHGSKVRGAVQGWGKSPEKTKYKGIWRVWMWKVRFRYTVKQRELNKFQKVMDDVFILMFFLS